MRTTPNVKAQTTEICSFGYSRFKYVAVGETYVICVFSRRCTFSRSTQDRPVFDDEGDINLTDDHQ
jgi:hypothetical protein